MIQEQHLLSSKKHLLSTDQDFQIKLNLENTGRLLKETEINSLFNLDEQFNIERKNSTLYRIYGKINLLTYDEITKITNINSLTPENTTEIIKKFKEISNEDIDLLNKSNWAIQILYPFSADTITPITNDFIIFEDNFNSNKGWQISNTADATLSITNKMFIGIITPLIPISVTLNNIFIVGEEYEITYTKQGDLADTVDIVVKCGDTLGTIRTSRGTFIESLICTGNENLSFEFNSSNLNISQFDKDFFNIDNIVVAKKQKSQKNKYRRLFKVLTNINDYDVFKSGFERNIFSDKIVQFIFNKDIDILGLTDYLGRPISELYLGIVKSGSTKMIDLKEGFNRIYSDSVNNFVHQIGDSYIGDEVIFDNNLLIQETVGSRFHKFKFNETGNLVFEDNFNNNFNKGWIFSHINGGEIINNFIRLLSLAYETVSASINVLIVGNIYTIVYDIIKFPQFGQKNLHVKCGTNGGLPRASIGKYLDTILCANNGNLSFNFFNGTGAVGDEIEIDNVFVFEGNANDYYYKPFHKIDVKKFSNNIEVGNTGTTLGIPSYAEVVDDKGNRKWKDLLDVGTIEDGEGVDYPFVNSFHYLYNNYDLFIRRIQPFHNLSEIQAMGIGPINSSIISIINTFGDGESGVPLDPGEKCNMGQDKEIKEPGPSGPGTNAEDEQNKNQDDNNDPKC